MALIMKKVLYKNVREKLKKTMKPSVRIVIFAWDSNLVPAEYQLLLLCRS
jgi:hypothetical protein